MKTTNVQVFARQTIYSAVILAMFFATVVNSSAAGKKSYKIVGTYVEGCSCGIPCACELIGLEKGCEGVGAMILTGGKFDGVNLKGVKIANALIPGKWVRIYVDAPTPAQRDAAINLAKGLFADFGKCESATAARIDVQGNDGNFVVKVADGKIMSLKTEPVLGGDNKTPIKISNTKSKMNPSYMQGKTLNGSFNDGGHSFELKDSNSFFNKLNSKGEI